jgi:hypothetical protein
MYFFQPLDDKTMFLYAFFPGFFRELTAKYFCMKVTHKTRQNNMCQKSKVKKFVKMVWQDASNENDARFCKKEDMYRKLSGFDIFSVKLFDT